MIVSCKCLNVQIETKDEPVKFDKNSLGPGHNSSFFIKELLICEPLAITKRQECLIHEDREICGWIIYKCLNCNLLCYAESENKNFPTILLRPDLLTDPKQIEKLQNSGCYSQVYQIYVNWTDNSDKIYSPRSIALSPPKLKELQRQLSESVEKETKLVEDRIRNFTESQYSALDEFRTKAQNEYHSLNRILSETTCMNTFVNFPTQASTNKISSKLFTLSPKLAKPDTTPIKKNSTTRNLMNVKSNSQDSENIVPIKSSRINIPSGRGSNDSGLPPASYDAEGLFSLEDMDDQRTDYVSDGDLSESEGESGSHDEGIYIPHYKQRAMASSLPVNVPDFMIYSGSVPNDANSQIPIGRESEKKPDIAASIKALAKSLHGDRIFGDLPRPRLGSQI